MEPQSFSDDIRRYMSLLWHWAWLLILSTALAGGAAYLVSGQMTKIYQASTTILINEAPATRSTDYSSILTSERLTQTYSQMLTKQPVFDGVYQRILLDPEIAPLANMDEAHDIARMITVQPVRDTQLIDIKVEHSNPKAAAFIANSVAEVFAEQTQALQASRYGASKASLETQLAQLDLQIQQTSQALNDASTTETEISRLEAIQAQYRQTYAYLLQSYEAVRLAEAQSTSSVIQVETASIPQNPIRPKVMTNTMLAAAVGLMLAVGVIFLVEALDDTLRSPDEIARMLGVPILGVIARFDSADPNPVSAVQPRSPVAEAFRSLRTNIQFASVDYPLHTLLVTSPSPSDGKSTVAANLAVVLAQSNRRVAVMDADLRRPKVHKIMRLANRRGVSDLFVQQTPFLDGTLQKTETANLFAITSGSLPPNPSELLGSEKMSEIMRQVGEQVDLIILDTPPVLAVTDAAVLATRVDGVLLVVKPGQTKLAAAKQAVEQLRRVGANILGIVLNEVEIKRSRYYHYKGYYYAYYDSYGEPDASGKTHPRRSKSETQEAKAAQ